MTAEEYLIEYTTIYNLNKINDIQHLKTWLEKCLQKRMLRPLFISRGKGGGQTYKTLYEVFDIRHNKNIPCYFYNENPKAINELINNGHLPLQTWIDDTNPRLKF